MTTKHTHTSPNKTLLAIVIGFISIALIFKTSWTLWIALSLGALGLISNTIALKIHILWTRLGLVLGHVIPPILLSLIFFIVLFPLALLSRLFGDKDPLLLKKTDKSLFKTVDKSFEKETFEKTW